MLPAQAVAVVLREHREAEAELLELVHAGGGFRLVPRLVESRQQHRRQNCNNGYYYEQLN